MITRRFELTRGVYKTQKITEGGCTGTRCVCVGDEDVVCEIEIDVDRLIAQLSRKLRVGSNRTTFASGAIVGKVIRRKALHKLEAAEAK